VTLKFTKRKTKTLSSFFIEFVYKSERERERERERESKKNFPDLHLKKGYDDEGKVNIELKRLTKKEFL